MPASHTGVSFLSAHLDDSRAALALACRSPELRCEELRELAVVRGALMFLRSQAFGDVPFSEAAPGGTAVSLLARAESGLRRLLARGDFSRPQIKMLRGCLSRVATVRRRVDSGPAPGALAAVCDWRAAQLPAGDRS